MKVSTVQQLSTPAKCSKLSTRILLENTGSLNCEKSRGRQKEIEMRCIDSGFSMSSVAFVG